VDPNSKHNKNGRTSCFCSLTTTKNNAKSCNTWEPQEQPRSPRSHWSPRSPRTFGSHRSPRQELPVPAVYSAGCTVPDRVVLVHLAVFITGFCIPTAQATHRELRRTVWVVKTRSCFFILGTVGGNREVGKWGRGEVGKWESGGGECGGCGEGGDGGEEGGG
jgi:hypothetical protein